MSSAASLWMSAMMYSVIDMSRLSVVSIRYCLTCGGTRRVRVVTFPVGGFGGRPGRAFMRQILACQLTAMRELRYDSAYEFNRP